jgi:DNA helicase IV
MELPTMTEPATRRKRPSTTFTIDPIHLVMLDRYEADRSKALRGVLDRYFAMNEAVAEMALGEFSAAELTYLTHATADSSLTVASLDQWARAYVTDASLRSRLLELPLFLKAGLLEALSRKEEE